jgi:LacI family transcriptional regulator
VKPGKAKHVYTMRDVARLAGVSVATVSAVANDKQVVRPAVVARVREAMKALNYQPDHVARSLRVRRTTTIGVVIPDFASAFFVDVTRGIEDTARAAGYSVLLCNSNDDAEQEKRHMRTLLARKVDGILLASTDLYSVDPDPFASETPVVLFDRIPPNYKGAAVVIDNVQAAYRATRYLIDLGHRNLAFIAGRLDLSTGSDRADGFRKALEDSALPLRGEYFKRGDFHPESGYRSCLELLALSDPPTAIICSNGPMTLGLLRALQETGTRSPEYVSVLGFDEPVPDSYGFSISSLLKPELTVIAQPGHEVGKQAAATLLRMIGENFEDEAGKNIVTLPAELRVRGSASIPRAQPT